MSMVIDKFELIIHLITALEEEGYSFSYPDLGVTDEWLTSVAEQALLKDDDGAFDAKKTQFSIFATGMRQGQIIFLRTVLEVALNEPAVITALVAEPEPRQASIRYISRRAYLAGRHEDWLKELISAIKVDKQIRRLDGLIRKKRQGLIDAGRLNKGVRETLPMIGLGGRSKDE